MGHVHVQCIANRFSGKLGGKAVWSLLKEWTRHSFSGRLVIKLRWQMPIFLFRLLS